jgi:signal transduction histidine kinase
VGARRIDRALTEGQQRLDEVLKANLIGDLIAQVAIVIAWFIFPSPWVIVLWLTRWQVIGTIVWARREVDSVVSARPIVINSAGHLVGALTVTTIVPELAPITLLIIVCDVQLWYEYVSTRPNFTYERVAAVAAGLLSLLSLQKWTGVGQAAPQWLLLALLVGQGSGIALLAARQSWQTLTAARRQGEELAASRKRLQMADDEARRSLTESIAAGPQLELTRLRTILATSTTRTTSSTREVDSILSRAVGFAESAGSMLREIAHGLHVAELSKQGLATALSALPWGGSRPGRIEADLRPEPPPDVQHAVADLMNEVASWARLHTSRIEKITARWQGTDLIFGVQLQNTCGVDFIDVEPRLRDLAGAAGGEVSTHDIGHDMELVGHIPRAGGPPPEAVEVTNTTPSETLESYLRDGLAMTIVGLLVIAAVSAFLRSGQLVILGLVVGLIASIIAVGLAEVRRGFLIRAILLTSLETAIAAIGIAVLLPELSPVLVLITVLPFFVAPSVMSGRQFAELIVVQQLAAAFVLVTYVVHPSSTLGALLPTWLEAAVLFALPIALMGLLTRVYLATILSLEHGNLLLAASRRDIVRVARERRHELERDLHDGAQQIVLALGVQLRVCVRRLERGDGQESADWRDLLASVDEASEALTIFSSGSYPVALLEHGLAGGIERLARHCPQPTKVRVHVNRGLPAGIELATYYCCSEALQNVAKHAGDNATVDVDIRDAGSRVEFEIADTGRGYLTTTQPGHGLANMKLRVSRLLGDLNITSSPGNGCTVRGWLPLEEPAIVD